MANKIDIEVKIEENMEKTKIVIYTKEITEEISSLLKKLQEVKEEYLNLKRFYQILILLEFQIMN